jgi:hypothetical protein
MRRRRLRTRLADWWRGEDDLGRLGWLSVVAVVPIILWLLWMVLGM